MWTQTKVDKHSVPNQYNASLFAATVDINDAPAPFSLRFFAAGWSEEFYDSVDAASRRLETIIARGDRHFPSHTFVREFELEKSKLSSLMQGCLENDDAAKDYAVECVYENSTEQFHVEKIGSQSVIRQIYGPFLSSFPCKAYAR